MLSGKEILVKIIELSFGALIGGLITLLVFGTSTLEYKDGYKEQYFDIPAKVPDDLVIQYKGKKIENISVYDFLIYNRSYKDLKDVTIFFEVISKDGKPVPQIITRGLYPPSRLPESIGITEIHQKEKNLYSFNVDVVKQTGSDTYYLARFIFEGKETPIIKISIPKNAGIDIKEYSNWREYLAIAFIFIGMVLTIVVFTSLIEGRQSQGIWKKRKDRLRDILSRAESTSLSEQSIAELVDMYEEEFKPKEPYFYRQIRILFNKLKLNND